MITRRELQDVVVQVNASFEGVLKRLAALEAKEQQEVVVKKPKAKQD
jgi:hypothetical protein|tara:strand:- start:267 stop:407 length:141 start_codon:yes stop_codon:yes gene_type:complete